MAQSQSKKTPKQILYSILPMTFGSILAAYALEVFLIPNQIIDGGVVGCAILLSKSLGKNLFYFFIFLLNIPFIALA